MERLRKRQFDSTQRATMPHSSNTAQKTQSDARMCVCACFWHVFFLSKYHQPEDQTLKIRTWTPTSPLSQIVVISGQMYVFSVCPFTMQRTIPVSTCRNLPTSGKQQTKQNLIKTPFSDGEWSLESRAGGNPAVEWICRSGFSHSGIQLIVRKTRLQALNEKMKFC